MSAHTPGPWVEDDGHIFAESTREPVCEMLAYTGRETQEFFDRLDANARLIAAAPELLEALRELYIAAPTSLECDAFHHSATERHTHGQECGPANDYLAAIRRAVAAIAKATGEEA